MALAALVWLLLLPVRVLEVAWGLASTLVLLLVTLFLACYFVVTTFVAGADVTAILSDKLLGEFHIDYLDIRPFSQQVDLFGVEIIHPSGETVIRAGRVHAEMDMVGLAFWGLKKAVGVSAPMPIHFRKAWVDDYYVLLPFEPDGFKFPEVFMPAVVKPSEGPSGPSPRLTFTRIRCTRGDVDLVFPGWRMDAAVGNIAATMRIEGGGLQLNSESVEIHSFTMTGIMPDNVAFVTEVPSQVSVERFQMDLEELDARRVVIKHPDFDAEASLTFRFRDWDLPAAGAVSLSLHSPYRLEELTGGQIFGTAGADVELSGSLKRPDLAGTVRSPLLMVRDLPVENVEADFEFSMLHGLQVKAGRLEGRLWGSLVEVSRARLAILIGSGGKGDTGDGEQSAGVGVDLTLDACFEPVAPAWVAECFDVDALEMISDLEAGGCCRECRVTVDPTGVLIEGDVGLEVKPGRLVAESAGVSTVLLDGDVKLTSDSLAFRRLELVTDAGDVTAGGRVFWGDGGPNGGGPNGGGLRIEARLRGNFEELARVPALAELGVGGGLEIYDLTFSGNPLQPKVSADLFLRDARLMGQSLDSLDLDATYEEGRILARRFCFSVGGNSGCLAANLDLGALLAGDEFVLPLDLNIDEPLLVNLDELPFVSLPFSGEVYLGPAALTGVVSRDFEHTMSSLDGSAEVRASNFAMAGMSLGTVAATLVKKRSLAAVSPYAGLEILLAFKEVDLSLATIESGEVEVSLRDFRLPEIGRLLPLVAGSGSVRLKGVSVGRNRLASLSLSLDSGEDPSKVDFKGRVSISRTKGVGFSGSVRPGTDEASLKLDFDSLPIARLPFLPSLPVLNEYFSDTRVSGSVSARNLDLAAAAAGRYRELFTGLSGEGNLAVTGLHDLPEPVSSLTCKLSVRKGRITASPLQVKLANGTRARARFTYNPLRSRLSGSLFFSPTELKSLRVFASAGLPLGAQVSGTVSFAGPLKKLDVDASFSVRRFNAVGIDLGDAELSLTGKIGEQLTLDSEQFFPGFTLNGGSLDFAGGGAPKALLDLDFDRFDLARVLEGFPDMMSAVASGHATLTIDPDDQDNPFSLALDVEKEKLKACLKLEAFSSCMLNPMPASVRVTAGQVHLEGLSLSGDGHNLSAQGTIDFKRGWSMRLFAGIDVSRIPMLGDFLASYTGIVGTGDGGLKLSGPLTSPELDGKISIRDAEILPRNFGSEIEVTSADFVVTGNLADGDILVFIEEDVPVSGQMEEGRFSGYGWFRIAGFAPDSGIVNVAGQNIFYRSPGEYELLMSPRVEVEVSNLSSEDEAAGKITGDLFVAEGEYTRNFDTLLGSFTSAFGRSQERYSKPITEVLPFLKKTELDIRVQGGNFDVSSRFPFGETELTVNLDLKVKGTVDNLQLYDRMSLVPDGTITYKVVKRVFEVVKGAVDFKGDPAKPHLEVEAKTHVAYASSDDSAVYAARPDNIFDEGVEVRVHLAGVYPDITPTFTSPSHPEFDTADLQMLLLLGMTRRDLEGGAEGRGDVSINVLTDDVAGLVSKLVLAPFVDAVSLGYDPTHGGFRAEAATKIGRAMQLRTKVQQKEEGSEYSAGFEFRITDRLSLEGKMKTMQDEDSGEASKIFEGKFRILLRKD